MTTPEPWIEMSEQLRGIYHRQLPPRIRSHMNRVHRWAGNSFELRDKIAVDELFAYIAWLQGEHNEAEFMRVEEAVRNGEFEEVSDDHS